MLAKIALRSSTTNVQRFSTQEFLLSTHKGEKWRKRKIQHVEPEIDADEIFEETPKKKQKKAGPKSSGKKKKKKKWKKAKSPW